MNNAEKKSLYYHEKLAKIQGLMSKLDELEDHRNTLVSCGERKIEAFIEHKTHIRGMADAVPIPEYLGSKFRTMLIQDLDKEIEVVRSKLDKLL